MADSRCQATQQPAVSTRTYHSRPTDFCNISSASALDVYLTSKMSAAIWGLQGSNQAREGRLSSAVLLIPEKSDLCVHHRIFRRRRQHFLNFRPEPHGQRSFRPNFFNSSLSPWTTRDPRLTCVSEGNPFRRLLLGVKGLVGMDVV